MDLKTKLRQLLGKEKPVVIPNQVRPLLGHTIYVDPRDDNPNDSEMMYSFMSRGILYGPTIFEPSRGIMPYEGIDKVFAIPDTEHIISAQEVPISTGKYLCFRFNENSADPAFHNRVVVIGKILRLE